MSVSKIKNVSGLDLVVPALGGRLVIAGAVAEVAEDAVYGFTCQASNWQPADDAAQAAHEAAHAAELEAQGIVPEPEKKSTKSTTKRES